MSENGQEVKGYLFFDYDGTVFTHGIFSKENVRAMKEAREAGYRLILNTGRSRGGLDLSESREAGIEWDGTVFGGCDIEYLGRRDPPPRMPNRYAIRFLKFCLRRRVRLYLECEDVNYKIRLDAHEGKFSRRERREELKKVREHLKIHPLTKMTVTALPGKGFRFPHTGKAYLVRMSNYCEVYQNGTGKGIAILRFCRATGAELSDCVCFGDSMNDYEMFRTAPRSVAMSHAPEEIKALATFTASGEDGVAEGIDWLLGKKIGQNA